MTFWDFLDRHYLGLSVLVISLSLLATFLFMGWQVEKTKRAQLRVVEKAKLPGA